MLLCTAVLMGIELPDFWAAQIPNSSPTLRRGLSWAGILHFAVRWKRAERRGADGPFTVPHTRISRVGGKHQTPPGRKFGSWGGSEPEERRLLNEAGELHLLGKSENPRDSHPRATVCCERLRDKALNRLQQRIQHIPALGPSPLAAACSTRGIRTAKDIFGVP